MDDPACAVSDGILLQRDGRPDRQPEHRLERPRDLGDLRRGYDLAHRRRRRHKEQSTKIPASPESAGGLVSKSMHPSREEPREGYNLASLVFRAARTTSL